MRWKIPKQRAKRIDYDWTSIFKILSICQSAYLSIYLSIHPYLSIYPSIHLSIRPSIYLSILLICLRAPGYHLYPYAYLLTPSVLGRIFTMSFKHDKTILLTLGRVYRDKNVNGQSLHHFNSLLIFWSCIKLRNSKQNKY